MSSNESSDLNYLPTLDYDQFFDESSGSSEPNFTDVAERLTVARRSYFMLQSGIYNFINDCSKLKKKVKTDVSGNMLQTIKYEYISSLNTLLTTAAVSMRKRMDDDSNMLLGFEVPKTHPTKTIVDLHTIEPTEVTFVNKSIETLVTTFPSVMLYMKPNYQLEIKITQPKSVNYDNLSNDKIHVKTFKERECENFIRALTPELQTIDFDETTFGFLSADDANDILGDITDYQSTTIISHKLNDVLQRLSAIISTIENAHKSIVQQKRVLDI